MMKAHSSIHNDLNKQSGCPSNEVRFKQAKQWSTPLHNIPDWPDVDNKKITKQALTTIPPTKSQTPSPPFMLTLHFGVKEVLSISEEAEGKE